MNKLFLEILNMSITAGYCVLAVVLIRLLLKKFPKIYSYILWAVVFFRMVCPVSVKSVFSFLQFLPTNLGGEGTAWLNTDDTITGVINNIQGAAGLNAGGTSDVVQGAAGLNTNNGISDTINNVVNNVTNNTNVTGDTINQTVSDVISNTDSIVAGSSLFQNIITVTTIVWLVVALGLIVYSIVSAIRLKKKLENAVHIETNIYEVADLSTPFVFGFMKPRIYLPTSLTEPERSFVLMHELTHLRRKDYIIKQAAFFIVCVHWFNPLAWLAFCLMSKDMEMSCDESVIAKLSKEERADYSETLLSLATDKRVVGLSPLAFGEDNVKGRIKNVLNYKKPIVWVTVVIVAVLAVVLVGLAVNPEDKETGGENLEVESSNEKETLEAENFSEIEVAETEVTTEIEPMNDPVEVIEAYVEYMGNDWNSFAMLHVSEIAREYIVYFNNADNISDNFGFYNIKDAELLELVEIDFKDAEPFIGGSDSKKTVKTYAACINYSTNENNLGYANGIEYDVISVVVEDGLWKITDVENTGRYIIALANKDYALSEEYVEAAIEKGEWAEDGFEADKLLKKYRGDAVMYYDMEACIVDGYKLEPTNEQSYDINNLIKVSYYEQSDVSLYSYEAEMPDENIEFTSYNLLLEHDGIYQAFTRDDRLYLDNMFWYSSQAPELYDREFDIGYEADCDGDGESELLATIMQDYGSGGYTEYAIVVFDYNSATGLYDLYYIEGADLFDSQDEAVKMFIEEHYGKYSVNEYGEYTFEDGYMISFGSGIEVVYTKEDGTYDICTTV